MEKALITNLICNMIENVVMTIGVVYSAVIFKRFSLLWFLLLPIVNSVNVRIQRNDSESEEMDNSKNDWKRQTSERSE